ncbi:MAG: Gfo/Idh/MocA family oxidoreductase [Saprospiraceae bacterium]|nr:Gfo/Idh/MocA family oxidoreductase [Saprospiraceae bacterium]MCF8252690.1 Gfo/Idh/MocA family oxidoreductase [Saprospiraceae bacterium]MCF8314263.1 Gfo/Idh/MocA family oxidoreductase [Saprospiraceae bacterium]MCF8443094.1 Gfo/Idh/MocA family oxidoreductase [Saprospiraceae bacterium]
MLKIGVVGAGHLGRIHLKCLLELQEHFQLVGLFDIDVSTAFTASQQFDIQAFGSYEALLDAVDVVDIVTPTVSHFELAETAIERGKHLFIEKPVTENPAEAQALIVLAKKHGVTAQVGHVERFNPAMFAVREVAMNPMFIEAHRLANFNPRGTDVPVVLDLMIHDIDIVLSLVKSPVKTISASGVAVVSDSPDIANARIEFENGCVANLTASRISMKQMRKVRLFQKDAYISLDFLEKSAQVVRMHEPGQQPAEVPSFELETPGGVKVISMEMPPAEPVNAIREELKSLAMSILQKTKAAVTLEEGALALEVAWRVMEEIEGRLKN